MKNTHTPGPWRMTRSRHHASPITEWWVDSPTRKAMACLQVWDLNTNPDWRNKNSEAIKEHRETISEVEANARLIAAAPELLEALKEMLSSVDGDSDWAFVFAEASQKARAAIAKAEL